MRQKMIVGALLVLGAIAATGCFPQEDSCNIKTPGIYVQFEAVEEGDSAVGHAIFWTGDSPGGTNLELGDCGDAIAVNGVTLTPESATTSPIVYTAALDLVGSYEFVFTRPDEGDYVSTVAAMPPEVIVTAPLGGEIPRDQELDVTWTDNADGEIELLISGECIWDYPETLGAKVADNGSHTVAANGLLPQDAEALETCTAEVTLTRETADTDCTLDSALKGEIVGHSIGRTSFTTAPPAI